MSDGPVPLARYRFDCVAHTPIRLPDYAGSLLRGAFGRALRQVACITREKDCAPCALKAGCPYTAVFAPGRPAVTHPLIKQNEIPAPYVIEPPAWGARVIAVGEQFRFHMVLIGRALEHLPIVVLAWRRALARGIGPGDGAGDVVALAAEDGQILHTPAAGGIVAHAAVPPAPTFNAPVRTLVLRFSTPLRLQEQGRALPPQRLTPRPLILAAARRASLLAEFHGPGVPAIDWTALAASADALRDERRLEWRDWTRYSSRQRQTMELGGAIGEWALHGDLGHALPWLHLGQWLHVGKETVFGMGGYRLETGTPEHNLAAGGKDCGRPLQPTERKEEHP